MVTTTNSIVFLCARFACANRTYAPAVRATHRCDAMQMDPSKWYSAIRIHCDCEKKKMIFGTHCGFDHKWKEKKKQHTIDTSTKLVLLRRLLRKHRKNAIVWLPRKCFEKEIEKWTRIICTLAQCTVAEFVCQWQFNIRTQSEMWCDIANSKHERNWDVQGKRNSPLRRKKTKSNFRSISYRLPEAASPRFN